MRIICGRKLKVDLIVVKMGTRRPSPQEGERLDSSSFVCDEREALGGQTVQQATGCVSQVAGEIRRDHLAVTHHSCMDHPIGVCDLKFHSSNKSRLSLSLKVPDQECGGDGWSAPGVDESQVGTRCGFQA